MTGMLICILLSYDIHIKQNLSHHAVHTCKVIWKTINTNALWVLWHCVWRVGRVLKSIIIQYVLKSSYCNCVCKHRCVCIHVSVVLWMHVCVCLCAAAQCAYIMSYVQGCCHLPEWCVGVWRGDQMGVSLDEGPSPPTRAHTRAHTHAHTHTNTYGQTHSEVLLLLRQITWLHGNTLMDHHDKVSIDLPSIIWRHNMICHVVFVHNTRHASLWSTAVVSHTHCHCSTTQHALLLVSINLRLFFIITMKVSKNLKTMKK